jgi:hypothetical protein
MRSRHPPRAKVPPHAPRVLGPSAPRARSIHPPATPAPTRPTPAGPGAAKKQVFRSPRGLLQAPPRPPKLRRSAPPAAPSPPHAPAARPPGQPRDRRPCEAARTARTSAAPHRPPGLPAATHAARTCRSARRVGPRSARPPRLDSARKSAVVQRSAPPRRGRLPAPPACVRRVPPPIAPFGRTRGPSPSGQPSTAPAVSWRDLPGPRPPWQSPWNVGHFRNGNEHGGLDPRPRPRRPSDGGPSERHRQHRKQQAARTEAKRGADDRGRGEGRRS